MNKLKINKISGYSLMEVMVAIGVFSLLAVLVTQAIAITLKSTKKSDSANRVRADLDYAITVMERQLRNANSIVTACNETNVLKIDYTDKRNDPAYFECRDIGADTDGYIASGSATVRLTSSSVDLISCSFKCTEETGVPDSIDINLTAVDKKSLGGESSRVSVQTKVLLRTY